MTNSTYHDQAKTVADWIESTNPNPVNVPPDLVWMIATALGDQTPVWISSDLSAAITNPTGEVIVFTERTIIHVVRRDADMVLTLTRRSDVARVTINGAPEHEWGSRGDTPSWP